MNRIVRIEQLGTDTILRLPEDIAAQLALKPGESVELARTDEGVTMRIVDEQRARLFELANAVMERHDEALRRLAK
jgi:antitoxin component of MazEF toxin-antitoxin module